MNTVKKSTSTENNAELCDQLLRIGREELIVTREAQRVLSPAELSTAYTIHCTGDWYDEDGPQLIHANKSGTRYLTVFFAEDGTEFWIVTNFAAARCVISIPKRGMVARLR